MQYKPSDPVSRGQCGVTSAYILEAMHELGWQARYINGDLGFEDPSVESIPNHCWAEVLIGDQVVVIDLTADQTGFHEVVIAGTIQNLRAGGTRYIPSEGNPGGGKTPNLEPRLSILRDALAQEIS